eukprot:3872394-Rhodomonas_salina.2
MSAFEIARASLESDPRGRQQADRTSFRRAVRKKLEFSTISNEHSSSPSMYAPSWPRVQHATPVRMARESCNLE